MKTSMRFVLLGLLFSSMPFALGTDTLVIGKGAGLFSAFLMALNNIAWCDKNNIKPVMYWDSGCYYYESNGYNGSYNVWEYYFEPTSSASYQTGDPVRELFELVYAPDGSTVDFLVDRHPETFHPYRRTMNEILKKYIKIKSSLTQKIDDFYQKYMAKKTTIGIHIRGTDKKSENPPINPSVIFDAANEVARRCSNCQFLVATDEQAILERAKRELKHPIIYYNAYRSRNGISIHNTAQAYSKAKMGEEVVIEVQLLSRCHVFLHNISSVSTAVLFFNPNLHDMMYTIWNWWDGPYRHYYNSFDAQRIKKV